MKEKIRSVVEKLKNAVIITSAASLHCSMHLTANVYFGCGAMKLMLKQEEILKNTCKQVMLKR